MTSESLKKMFIQGIEEHDKIINTLICKHPQCDAFNIDEYFVHRCAQIQQIFRTFALIVSSTNDSHSANAILRVLADHVSSLKLIYTDHSREKIILRHLLYVMDGCKERIKLNKDLKKDANIDDYSKHNADKIIMHEKDVVNKCKRIITRLQLYNPNKSFIDKLIQCKCWRFRDGFKDVYSWKDMYIDVLEMPNNYISYLSQHVHGLAGSIGVNDDNPEYLLYGIALCLQLLFSKTITDYSIT